MATSNDLNIAQAGYVVFDGTATFSGRTFQAGAGITLTNPDGTAGNTTISLTGGSSAIESVNVDTTTGAGTNPVLPTAGAITITGGQYASGTFGTRVITAVSTAASTLAIEAQISSTNATSLATKNGLSHYNSTQFSVDANGFVSSITGSFTWVDVTTATQTLAVQTGYVTDHTNVTYTLPATANLGDQIRIVGKLGITTIAQNAGQQILMSSASSTVGATGSIVGTNVGDCVWLVCVTAGASTVWRGESFVGNWTIN
jgi:hypothetical protein